MVAFIYILIIIFLFIMFPLLHIIGVTLLEIIITRLNLHRKNLDTNS